MNKVKPEPDVWIITWQYRDSSSYGIVGAYDSEELAAKDLELLENHGDSDKKFEAYGLKVEGR